MTMLRSPRRTAYLIATRSLGGPFVRARYFHMFQLCKYWVKAKGVSEPSPKGSILPEIKAT
jgi:hypothetical protein